MCELIANVSPSWHPRKEIAGVLGARNSLDEQLLSIACFGLVLAAPLTPPFTKVSRSQPRPEGKYNECPLLSHATTPSHHFCYLLCPNCGVCLTLLVLTSYLVQGSPLELRGISREALGPNFRNVHRTRLDFLSSTRDLLVAPFLSPQSLFSRFFSSDVSGISLCCIWGKRFVAIIVLGFHCIQPY
jgi:hypothetical protein